MSAQPFNLVDYGLTNALQSVFPGPVIAKRAPTVNDIGYQIGRIWVVPATSTSYILVKVAGGIATWNIIESASSLGTTQFAVQVGNATGGLFSLPLGTSGQVLSSQGAGSNPHWITLPTGITTLAGDSGTATGSTVTIAAAELAGITAVTINATGLATMTITGDTGSATGSSIALHGQPQAGSTVKFTASGSTVLMNLNDTNGNLFLGTTTGNGPVSGVSNTAIGGTDAPMSNITTGQLNSCYGAGSCQSLTTGSNNSAFGMQSFVFGDTGSGNCLFGNNSGIAYTGAESNNIVIGAFVTGVLGESNVLHIGDSGASAITKAFIGGIAGVTTTVNDAVAVLISASTGQLGTVSSSLKYKEDVKDMGSYSDVLSKLRPVTFHYKKHAAGEVSVGLIAEEVAQVAPALVVYKDGEAETVRYHDLVPMLLNELLKLSARVAALESK